MAQVACAKCNGTGRVSWSSFRAGVCFDCNGRGKRAEKPAPKQDHCTCSPETWCFMPGHNFDKAFPDQAR